MGGIYRICKSAEDRPIRLGYNGMRFLRNQDEILYLNERDFDVNRFRVLRLH